MKDNFSLQSVDYAEFRPSYPPEMFEFLYEHCAGFERAWDGATGNGQIAGVLAERFEQVFATDISTNQLENAVQKPNIQYGLGQAEKPDFSAHSLDLITIGQAAHWFDLPVFYAAAQQVLKPSGLLGLVGYNLLQIDEQIDAVVQYFYQTVLDGCWDDERYLVEKGYQTIPFPLLEIPFPPHLCSQYTWTVQNLLGYLRTWSAVQHFKRKNGRDPFDLPWVSKLKAVWPENELKTVQFPIFGRVGKF